VDHHTLSFCICTVRGSVMIHCDTIYVQSETVMIHCDTLYVQSETVWWSTVILYMYSQREWWSTVILYMCSQRQCDDPLWYYICTVRDGVMIHCACLWLCIYSITVDHHTVSDCTYIISVDHHTVSDCTYIVSQWIITLSLRDSVMIHCDAICVQSATVWWSTVILYMYS
jgi:hypothetical protein